MYARKHFSKEEINKYEIIPNDKKNDWVETMAYFTNLYAMWKSYSEDRAVEIGLESTEIITHIAPLAIIRNDSFKMNIGSTTGSIIPT